jgi:hypothetical protein
MMTRGAPAHSPTLSGLGRRLGRRLGRCLHPRPLSRLTDAHSLHPVVRTTLAGGVEQLGEDPARY